jgi:hypothetical protein
VPDAIVAFAALDDPQLDILLAAQARHERVRGIRHIVNWHPDPARSYTPRDLTQGPAWQAGYARWACMACPSICNAIRARWRGWCP